MERNLLEAISRGDVETVYNIWRINVIGEHRQRLQVLLATHWSELLQTARSQVYSLEGSPQNMRELVYAYDKQQLYNA